MDRTRDHGYCPVVPLLVSCALSSIIAMVVSLLHNSVHRIFIGREVGWLAPAGITVAFPLQLPQIAFPILIGVDASALISIGLGEQKREKARQILGNGFLLNLIASVTIAGIGWRLSIRSCASSGRARPPSPMPAPSPSSSFSGRHSPPSAI